jgi:signal transduction histidine kinase
MLPHVPSENSGSVSDSDAMPVDRVNIMLLEDDRSYQKIVTAVLESSRNPHFEVVTVGDLRSALQALRDQDFDLLIVDLNVPDSQGLDTFLSLHEEAPETPVMVLSATEEDSLAIQAVKSGAQDYLNKGKVTPQALIRSVRYSIERARAEQARLRLEAVQDFTQTLAHDMSVPLLGASRMLDLLLEGHAGQLSEEQTKLVSVLSSSNKKLIALVNRLLEAYKFESPPEKIQFQTIDLSRAVDESVALCTSEAQKREIDLVISHAPLKPCKGNSQWLITLFRNLLENAIKFSSSGSKVIIKTLQEGNFNQVIIEDNGKGLSPDKARHFRRFWQSQPGKQYVAETGLGLYISQRIARAHRAKIKCTSLEGQGTTITVLVPID